MGKPENEKGLDVTVVENDFDPIAAALKQLHLAVASEAVPENFLRILDEIDAKIAARKSLQ